MRKLWTVLITFIIIFSVVGIFFKVNVGSERTFKENDFIYSVNKDDTINIISYMGKEKIIYIPCTIKGKKVTRLLNGAFSKLNIISAIYIPNTITNIENKLFSDYSDLIIYGESNSYANRYAKENDINFISLNKLKLKGVYIDSTYPKVTGDVIKSLAKAEGGMGDVIYEFRIYKDNKLMWNKSGYSNEAEWLPVEAGYYTMKVTVKDKVMNVVEKEFEYNVVETINIINFKTNLASPQSVNKYISIKADTINGYGDILYRYEIKKDGRTVKVKDYSKEKIMIWQPQEEGEYTITVMVCDGDNKKCEKSIKYQIKKVIDLKDVTFDKESPQEVGTSIKIKANYSGGAGDVKCHFCIAKSGINYFNGDVQGATIKWVPSEGGLFTIIARVEDSEGNIAEKQKKFFIKKDLKITACNTDLKSPQKLGSVINIVVNALNENGNIEYMFVIKNGNREVWRQEYSEKSVAKWCPKKEGIYDIYIYANDGKQVVSQEIKGYKITK